MKKWLKTIKEFKLVNHLPMWAEISIKIHLGIQLVVVVGRVRIWVYYGVMIGKLKAIVSLTTAMLNYQNHQIQTL